MVAALPQRVWEVSATALATYLVVFGSLMLSGGTRVRGEGGGDRDDGGKGFRALSGCFQIIVGLAVGTAAFFVHPEPRCTQCAHGPWGSPVSIAGMFVWLALLLGSGILRVRRYLNVNAGRNQDGYRPRV